MHATAGKQSTARMHLWGIIDFGTKNIPRGKMRFFFKKGRRERERERKKHQSHAREIRERDLLFFLPRAGERDGDIKKGRSALKCLRDS